MPHVLFMLIYPGSMEKWFARRCNIKHLFKRSKSFYISYDDGILNHERQGYRGMYMVKINFKLKDIRLKERDVSKITKDEWIEMYEDIAKNPYSWLNKAAGLLSAAKKVLSKGNDDLPILYYINTYMMLNSFALENIIKCIIIQEAPDASVNNGELNDKINEHDLIELFNDANILENFTKTEQDLLKRFSIFAVIWGRYPIPLTWQKYKEALYDKKENYKKLSSFNQRDIKTVDEIIDKLSLELKSIGIDPEI